MLLKTEAGSLNRQKHHQVPDLNAPLPSTATAPTSTPNALLSLLTLDAQGCVVVANSPSHSQPSPSQPRDSPEPRTAVHLGTGGPDNLDNDSTAATARENSFTVAVPRTRGTSVRRGNSKPLLRYGRLKFCVQIDIPIVMHEYRHPASPGRRRQDATPGLEGLRKVCSSPAHPRVHSSTKVSVVVSYSFL